MSDIFVSYSRKDRDFVMMLHDRLQLAGMEVWLDFEDIPASGDWWDEIQSAITAANNFIFILSPDSLNSTVNQRELATAVEFNKRIIPILRHDVDSKTVPEPLASLNWLVARSQDDLDQGIEQLIGVLQTDSEYVRAHTHLMLQAREWDKMGRDASHLLQGSGLATARDWLEGAVQRTPAPTALQSQYIMASLNAGYRRQQVRLGLLGAALGLVALVLIGLFVALPQDANTSSRALVVVAGGSLVLLVLSNGLTFLYMRQRNLQNPIIIGPESDKPATRIKISRHIFLSYSRQDITMMQRVKSSFIAQQIPVWTDENLVPGTPEWEREIENGIKSAGGLVVLLSPNSVDSKWVRREIAFAENFAVRIFPVLIDGDERSAIPVTLVTYQYVDLRQRRQFDTAFTQLVDAIITYLSNEEFQRKLAG